LYIIEYLYDKENAIFPAQRRKSAGQVQENTPKTHNLNIKIPIIGNDKILDSGLQKTQLCKIYNDNM